MSKLLYIAILSAAAVLPGQALAQTAAPAQTEIAQIQTQLAALQTQAMQDSAVLNARTAFESYLTATVARLDPSAKTKLARAEALQAEAEAARAANDNAKLNALAAEASTLQEFFVTLQQRAFAEADVQEQRKAFLTILLNHMNRIDPQAQVLVDRLQQLRSGTP